MFNKDFFPTPDNVIEIMLRGEDIQGKIILEPSAGKGNIVDYLMKHGAASVSACETNSDLRMILAGKCNLIGDDFLQLTSEQVSHFDLIVMNPPFSADEKHILHAYSIAPAGCKIISLCNLATVEKDSYRERRELQRVIEDCGSFEDLGECFGEAERRTSVEVACVRLQKEGASYKAEFEGFFMDEEPEQAEGAEAGLMSYNFIRDLVHRYISAVKLYDEQLNVAVKMNNLTEGFYYSKLATHCTEDGKPKARNEFKKDLQKAAWKFIFDKMDLQRVATRGLREDINKFVETQTAVPFTMKNIFRMLEIVIGTTGQRMDKAILEAFDSVTRHYHDNRYSVEGWKTNSHYLLNRRFIFPYMVEVGWHGQLSPKIGGNFETIEDFIKSLCYLTGEDYAKHISLYNFLRYRFKLVDKNGAYVTGFSYGCNSIICGDKREEMEDKANRIQGSKVVDDGLQFGKWMEWGFFKIRCYKKGTMHFEFKDETLWGRYNQHIAKLKGYPLFEHTNADQKKKEQEQAKRAQTTAQGPTTTGKVLFKVKIAA